MIKETEWEFVQSEWSVYIDGITKTATEYNSKTGESRPYDYEQAMRELLEE